MTTVIQHHPGVQRVALLISTGQMDRVSRWDVHRRTKQIEDALTDIGAWKEEYREQLRLLHEEAESSL